MHPTRHPNTWICALLAITASASCFGGGFQVSELSVREQGYRNAGSAVAAESASTTYFNPAGLALLERPTLEIGGHFIVPSFAFSDQASTNAIGGPTIGRGSVNAGSAAVVPNAYLAWPLDQDLTFGLGITAPYGLVTKHDTGWVGRYHALLSDLLTLDVNPALGYRVSQDLSIGAGLSLQYLDVNISNSIDFGSGGFLSGLPGFQPSHPDFDGLNQLDGDSWGIGLNLGLIYQLTDDTRIGLSYRSRVDQKISGRNRVTVPDSLAPLEIVSFERNARAEVEIPASAQLGLAHALSNKLTLYADAQWTDWSSFRELRIRPDGAPDLVQPEMWQDAWRYSLGLSYDWDERWTFRSGLQYDETPIPDGFRTPRIPGDDRYWSAVGLTYRVDRNIAIDLAYSHVFLGDYGIEDTEVYTASTTGLPVGNTLRGDFDAAADVISLQVTWTFD